MQIIGGITDRLNTWWLISELTYGWIEGRLADWFMDWSRKDEANNCWVKLSLCNEIMNGPKASPMIDKVTDLLSDWVKEDWWNYEWIDGLAELLTCDWWILMTGLVGQPRSLIDWQRRKARSWGRRRTWPSTTTPPSSRPPTAPRKSSKTYVQTVARVSGWWLKGWKFKSCQEGRKSFLLQS